MSPSAVDHPSVPAIRALLDGIVDYAGLFPPASLSFDEAIRMFDRHRRGRESWILGRFVCPAARLVELAGYQNELFSEGPSAKFTALGRGGTDRQAFLAGLQTDLDLIAEARALHGGRIQIDSLETKLPALAGSDLAATLAQAAAAARTSSLRLFIEVPIDDSLPERLTAIAAAGLAAKFRTGGTEAAAFPSTKALALALGAAARAAIPFKCTAGLHHPVRHFNRSVQAEMHGFLNVFIAGMMTNRHRWTDDLTQLCLEERDPGAFDLDSDSVRWRHWRLTAEEIRAGRANATLSFGSCSFDEPCDDLRAMGWL